MSKYNVGFVTLGNSIDLITKNISGKAKIGGVVTYQSILAKYLVNNYKSKFYVKILNLNPNEEFKILKNNRYDIIIAKHKKFKLDLLNIPYSHFIEPFHNALLSAKFLKDVDIFHFNNFADAGLIKSIYPKTHVIYTVHGRILPRNTLYYLSPYYKIEDRFALIKMKNAVKHSDALITVDSAMDKELYQFAKKFDRKIFLIPNGIDINKFNPEVPGYYIREKYNISEDATVIISTSRFAYQRRIEMLIKAFAKINKKLNDVYLMLVGDGPRKNEFMQLVRELNIEKNVIFAGAIPNWILPNYYTAADIAFNSFTDVPTADALIHTPSLLNSIEKVHPISISFSTLESLSSGLPVIAVVKKVSGYNHIDYESMEEDCGILVPKDNLEALTKTLKIIISNSSLRQKMSSNAREVAIKKRNLNSTIKKTLEVYEHVLST